MLKHLTVWNSVVFGAALLVCIPILALVSQSLVQTQAIWRHLMDYLLLDLIINTFLLVLGVLSLSLALGISLAWIVSTLDFPGRRFFDWALILPFSVPTYVIAFVMVGLFDFAGPIQTWLRETMGINMFLPIRSRLGTIFVMGLSFYPYVYLTVRSGFRTQGQRLLEASNSLGFNHRESFFKLALPMARPWIAAGATLVVMETLADFGAVSIFNYDTFTTAIYKAWFGFFSLSSAAQLSLLLMCVVLGLKLLLGMWGKGRQYIVCGRCDATPKRLKLSRARQLLITTLLSTVFFFSFALPLGILIKWSFSRTITESFTLQFLGYLTHTLLLAGGASFAIVALALLLAYGMRLQKKEGGSLPEQIATLGYAFPGSVLAVGIFIPLAWLDRKFGASLITGSLVGLLLAYTTRFLAVAHGPLKSGTRRITFAIDESARSLGEPSLSVLRRVHIPMLRGGLVASFLLVFVEVMKEMPATLLMRPFGWDTLAIRVFEMTTEGEWQRAALPALALVAVGIIPVMVAWKKMK